MVGFQKIDLKLHPLLTIIPQEISSQIKSAVDKIKHIPSNPVNTDTEGSIESVRINGVSALKGLNLEKM